MKKLICLILTMLILFPNAVFAKENWVYVSAPNRKRVEVDTSSIGIIGNDVTFNARAEVNKDKYFYTMRMNLEEKTMKISDIQKYTGNNDKCDLLRTGDITYNRYVKSGTLDESMLLFIDDTTKYDIRREDWNEWLPYHIKVMKTIKKNWKPKFADKYSFRYCANCEIQIDKHGNIVNYEIDFPDNNSGKFASDDALFVASVEKAIKQTGRVKKLPRSYKGESIKIKMAFIYYYDSDDKKNLTSNIDDMGYHEVNILKKKEPSYRLQNAFSQTGKVFCATCKFIGQAIAFTIVAGAVVAFFGLICFI